MTLLVSTTVLVFIVFLMCWLTSDSVYLLMSGSMMVAGSAGLFIGRVVILAVNWWVNLLVIECWM